VSARRDRPLRMQARGCVIGMCACTGCAVLMQTGGGPSPGITRCQLCHLPYCRDSRLDLSRLNPRDVFRLVSYLDFSLSLSLSLSLSFSLFLSLCFLVIPCAFLPGSAASFSCVYSFLSLFLLLFLTVAHNFAPLRVYLEPGRGPSRLLLVSCESTGHVGAGNNTLREMCASKRMHAHSSGLVS